jgi:uncharacterized protein YciI
MGDKARAQYMYVMHPVDSAKAASQGNWTPEDAESFRLHWDRLEQALNDGVLILAGRAQNADGAGPAIVIFEADSEDDARRFFASEPFITRGFATGELHPFAIALARDAGLVSSRKG